MNLDELERLEKAAEKDWFKGENGNIYCKRVPKNYPLMMPYGINASAPEIELAVDLRNAAPELLQAAHEAERLKAELEQARAKAEKLQHEKNEIEVAIALEMRSRLQISDLTSGRDDLRAENAALREAFQPGATMKYYFISYIRSRHGEDVHENTVIDFNPIEWQTACHPACTLVWYSEISREEYDTYNDWKDAPEVP